MVVTANELKTKGVSLLETLLNKRDEVMVSVRGKSKYVVVDIERYSHLRELELEQAYREVKEDLRQGRARTMTADEHLKELDDALRA